ncbi:MAG: hypothetical protein KKE86_15010, partial [Planctomycetes bacterium]|nr:hypothetical protein [Planctomycetota bacterium]
YFHHREQLAAIATEHLRLIVTGPSSLQDGVAAAYTVSTTAIDGRALPAEIEVALLDPNGERLKAFGETADENGRLKVVIPADAKLPPRVMLKVTASHRGNREEAEAELAVEPDPLDTRLTLDRSLYRPGETVHFRSQTLSRFRLAEDRRRRVRFEVVGPGGAAVPGMSFETVSRRGVAAGAYSIPADLPDGRYALVVRGDKTFPTTSSPLKKGATAGLPSNAGRNTRKNTAGQAGSGTRREFSVRRDTPSRLKKELEFFRDGYAPGDRVVADFKARRAEGGAAAGARLRFVAEVDGRKIFKTNALASDTGTFRVDFRLPEEIERGDGRLSVEIDDGNSRETLVKTIPIDIEKIDVAFHPEGGELVAGLENRVYFTARNRSGKPVHLSGEIVGDGGEDGGQQRIVASVETVHDGMGTFSFVPRAGKSYRLIIKNPPGAVVEPKLPEPNSERGVVLTADEGVFDAGAALKFHVRWARASRPLVAAAYAQGAQVGQQPLPSAASSAADQPIQIHLDDAVVGAIRLVVFDYGVTPPEPLAERIVYRRPGRKLNVRMLGAEKHYSPGESVELSLLVTDETGQPVPASLGISAAKLPANQIERNAGFDPEKSPAKLDLLLGTRKWRRFGEQPPLMFDNVEQINSNYEKSLADYQADRTGVLDTLTAASFFGGLGLVVLVAMLGLMRIVSGIHLWVSAVGATTCCMILGAILMDPGRLASGHGAVVAFASYQAPLPEREQRLVVGPPSGATSDFAETIYWRPLLIADQDGKAAIRFDLPKDATTFGVSVDAHGAGRVGSRRISIVSRLPFGLEAKLPPELSAGDRVDLPLDAINHTDGRLPVELNVEHGERTELDGPAQRRLELDAGGRQREYLVLNAADRPGDDTVTIRGSAGRLTDAVVCPLRIVPSGFPVRATYGGVIDGKQELIVTLPEKWIPGSLKATFVAFPSPLAELQEWLDDSLSGPNDCCERTLASNFCAAMIARFLFEWNTIDPDLLRRMKRQLAEGHARLARYECKGGGFDQFGGETADASLTAFAMMQFDHAERFFRADPAMAQRTAEWLMSRRNGKGGFQRDPQTPSDAAGFGSARASVLALKAMVERARGDGGTPNPGKLIVQRDGQTIGQYGFSAGVRDKIAIDGLEANLKAGENKLAIELTGGNKMPYSLSVEYHSLQPENNDACPLRLTTKLDKSKLKAGETVALTAEWENVSEREQPMAVAVVGLPAGLTPQVDQLEELIRAETIDHYEIHLREVVLYRRRLLPKQRVEVRLDLEAAVPGRFVGPPSRTYLYSAPEQRQWCDPPAVEITRDTFPTASIPRYGTFTLPSTP